jgi:class 3 adenylate cyclase
MRAMAGGSPEHRRVLRKVFAAEGGVEVDTRGDAFFYVFTDARAAFAAGAAANVVLEPGLIRIRMSLHTGLQCALELSDAHSANLGRHDRRARVEEGHPSPRAFATAREPCADAEKSVSSLSSRNERFPP